MSIVVELSVHLLLQHLNLILIGLLLDLIEIIFLKEQLLDHAFLPCLYLVDPHLQC